MGLLLRILFLLLISLTTFQRAYGDFQLISVDFTPVTCFGESDGIIRIEVAGGDPDYFFSYTGPNGSGNVWSDETVHEFTGIVAGPYSITVWDSQFESAGSSGSITQPQVLTVNITPSPAGTCPDTDLQLYGNPSGGNDEFDYIHQWTGSGVIYFTGSAVIEDPLFNSGDIGTYDLTYRVEDHKGCFAEESIPVDVYEAITASFTSSDVTCFGGNDGSVTIIDAEGGSENFQYSIDGINWQSEDTFDDLIEGNYNIWVRDALHPGDCNVMIGTANVNAPDPIVINSVDKQDITCNGLDNGTITVAAAGGTGNLLYSINDGAGYIDNSGFFSSLEQGIYEVSVMDLNGCIIEWGTPLEISEPDPLFATVDSSNVTYCHGYTNGWIEIDFVEGSWAENTGNYEYTIDGGLTWSSGNLFEDLGAGTYDVQARDADNPGCYYLIDDELVLVEPDPITAGFEFDPVSCYDGNDGRIKFINITGGDPDYHYQFSIDGGTNHKINPEFKNLSHGTYDLTIRNSALPPNHCPVTIIEDFVLPEAALLSAMVTAVDVTECHGNTNGSIEITDADGGSGDYEFSADGGASWQAGAVFTALGTGTYQVYMRDANAVTCEMFLETVEIEEPELLTASYLANDVSCSGGSDGSILISGASGGSGAWEFSAGGSPWQSGFSITGLPAGDHEVLMRDESYNSCLVILGIAGVNEPDPVALNPLTVTDNKCFGDNEGSIEALALGGTPDYIYSLYEGASFLSSIEPVHPEPVVFAGLSAGTEYRLEVTDSRGCDPAVETAIVITEPDELVISSVDIGHVDCHGEESGTITITATGGSGLISYSVNGSDFFAGNVFEDLAAGYYEVEVMDENGCITSYGTVEVEQPDKLVGNISVTPVTCAGEANGIIEITDPAGGTAGNYNYSINGADWQTGAVFNHLAPGSYNVFIGDSDVPGCFTELEDSPAEITEPSELVLTAEVEDVDCNGNMTGSITANAAGGNGNFEYRLNGGTWQTGNLFESLAAGDYLVEVSDPLGCTASLTETVNEPDALVFDDIDSFDETCAGAKDGFIQIDVNGGTPVFNYSIDGGGSFQEDMLFDNLEPNTYNIEVHDANGCVITYSSLLILAATEIVIDDLDITDASCYGALDGSIDVESIGGSGTLEYSLDGLTYQSAGLFTGLPGGEYSLYVKDAKDCVDIFDITVGQPAELQLSTQGLNTECYGNTDDPEIIATATGGSAPYTVTLYLGGVEQASFVNTGDNETVLFESLVPGMTDYEVVVEDAAGCPAVSSGMLSTVLPGELVIDLFNHTDITCFGVNEGTIEVEVSGGTPPYLFMLTDEAGNPLDDKETGGNVLFEDRSAGSYIVRVTDANGCGPVETDVMVIDQPDEIIIVDFDSSDISCFGADDGQISINASGGTGVLQYSVNGGVDFFNSGSFTGLSAGDYEVMVTDDEGCAVGLGITEIAEPDELLFAAVNVNNIIIGSGVDYGSVTIEMTGGTGTYLYSLDDGGSWQADNHFDNLPIGLYDLSVMDDNGCTAETTFEIVEITGITASIDASDPSCNGFNDGGIFITASLGAEPYQYSIDGGVEFVSTGDFSGLEAGTYDVVVRDDGGLVHEEVVTLNDPAPIVVTASISSSTCLGLSLDGPDGEIELNVSGGTGSYSFLWSNDVLTKDIVGVESGEYSVTITDDNSCQEILNFTVGYENDIEVSLPGEIFICHGEGVELNPVVQTDPEGSLVTYSWLASDGPDPQPVATPTVWPLSPTYYSVRVIDDNRCYDEAEVLVNQYPLQGLFVGNDTVVLHGTSLELEAATGGEFDNYEWAPSTGLSEITGPSTIALITNDIKYVVRAETINGCLEYDSIFIEVLMPAEPVSGFTPNNDGANDYFDIPNAEDYPNIEVAVYNRAGQRVFYSKGYTSDKRWDGTFNGRDLPVGTYYYVISFNDVYGSRPLTGPVTILR